MEQPLHCPLHFGGQHCDGAGRVRKLGLLMAPDVTFQVSDVLLLWCMQNLVDCLQHIMAVKHQAENGLGNHQPRLTLRHFVHARMPRSSWKRFQYQGAQEVLAAVSDVTTKCFHVHLFDKVLTRTSACLSCTASSASHRNSAHAMVAVACRCCGRR
jgi:hypothetical protein